MAPKTLLKVLVDNQRLTYAAFDRLFTNTGDRLFGKGRGPTCGESQYRRWTGGRLKGLPGNKTCQVLEEMFGRKVEDLFSPPPPDSNLPAHTDNWEVEILMAAQEAHRDADAFSASISDLTTDQLHDQIVSLARNYHMRPPHDVFRDVDHLRKEMERQRDRTRVPAQQQKLLVLCGQATALLASAAFDLGSITGARSLARAAALYGETARYEPLRAYADATLAYLAYYAGEPYEAVTLTSRALSYGGLGDVARRRILAIQTRAHAHLGDDESTQRTMLMSDEVNTAARDDLHDDVGGEFSFPSDRMAMSHSTSAILIRDSSQAEAMASRALDLLSQRPVAERTLHVLGSATADLALSRLMAGNLDGAVEVMGPVWEIPGPQRVTGVLMRLTRLRRYLAQSDYHGVVQAIDLAERIEDFQRTATSAVNLLGHQAGILALEA